MPSKPAVPGRKHGSYFRADGPGTRVFPLDVGTKEGEFLQGLPDAWKKIALESNTQTHAALARKNIQVLGGYIHELPDDGKTQFDALCLFDVFEHLRNPYEVLIGARRFLKPGGLLLVSTANMDAWDWRWQQHQHGYLETPQHLSFLSKPFLKWFSMQSGMNVIKVIPISHRKGAGANILSDMVRALYCGCKVRGGLWRLGQRAIQAVPMWRYLMHKQSLPTAFYLKNHLLAAFSPATDTLKPGQMHP